MVSRWVVFMVCGYFWGWVLFCCFLGFVVFFGFVIGSMVRR